MHGRSTTCPLRAFEVSRFLYSMHLSEPARRLACSCSTPSNNFVVQGRDPHFFADLVALVPAASARRPYGVMSLRPAFDRTNSL